LLQAFGYTGEVACLGPCITKRGIRNQEEWEKKRAECGFRKGPEERNSTLGTTERRRSVPKKREDQLFEKD